MTLKEDIQAWAARWQIVEARQAEELRLASIEQKWRQLSAACALARGLGLLQEDPSEAEVYERWAILKEKLAG